MKFHRNNFKNGWRFTKFGILKRKMPAKFNYSKASFLGAECGFLGATHAFLQCDGFFMDFFARLTAEKPSF
jgi:hypothetical protein